MPPRQRMNRKRRLDLEEREELITGRLVSVALGTGEPIIDPADSWFASDDERRAAWRAHRDELLAEAAADERQRPLFAEEVFDNGLSESDAHRRRLGLDRPDRIPPFDVPLRVELHDGRSLTLDRRTARVEPDGTITGKLDGARLTIAASAVEGWEALHSGASERPPGG